MQFEFATATRILFGRGTIHQLGGIAASFGKNILLVTNFPEIRVTPILAEMSAHGFRIEQLRISSEPIVEDVLKGVELTGKHACNLVIGLGGGSAIDLSKAIAALSTNPGTIYDYLEVIGKGLPITRQPIPMIAIPTTAGTGAEVTRNAVLGSPNHRVKVSLRSPMLLPRLAIIDPELTFGLPPTVTASTGLDALTQLIEPFVSVKANPLTDAICREGMKYLAGSLYKAYQMDDPMAREHMALASLLGGMALANSGLGVVHGFASVLGGVYQVPHGLICARLLPAAMRVNLHVLKTRLPESLAIRRYKEIARLLTGDQDVDADDGITWVGNLVNQLGVASITSHKIPLSEVTEIVKKIIQASSTKANPIQLTPDELEEILSAI